MKQTPKHPRGARYEGTPCKICQNTTRYVAGTNCVACLRLHSKNQYNPMRAKPKQGAPANQRMLAHERAKAAQLQEQMEQLQNTMLATLLNITRFEKELSGQP